MRVPYVDLAANYASLKVELDAAVGKVAASGSYVMGENVAAFEREFGDWLGGLGVAALNSGTDAIYLTLRALEIGPGDEVITVSHTAVNTVLAISKAGATPVLVDIDPESYCLQPEALAGAITGRTRAIISVHLYGHPVDMDLVMAIADAEGIPVIEDCAQAHGARYRDSMVGSIGAASCYSFYPTKNLGAAGDGGAVASRDAEIIDRVRSLANCGQGDERYINLLRGDVSRLDEIQAAILRIKLPALDGWTDRRRRIASRYDALLADTPLILPCEREWGRHVYHLYVVRSGERDALREHLSRAEVAALIHYPVPVHRQPAYAELASLELPHTDEAVTEILSLPVYPEMADEQVEHVAAAVKSFYS
jgi:dTDP-4-amino-4,6-dideoxygalactose transaminase